MEKNQDLMYQRNMKDVLHILLMLAIVIIMGGIIIFGIDFLSYKCVLLLIGSVNFIGLYVSIYYIWRLFVRNGNKPSRFVAFYITMGITNTMLLLIALFKIII